MAENTEGQQTQELEEQPADEAEQEQGVLDEAGGGERGKTDVHPAKFEDLTSDPKGSDMSLDLILDISMPVTVELGRTTLTIQKLLQLGVGSVVELDKMAGEPADLYLRGVQFARGEVVVVDNNFGICITEITDRKHRIQELSD